MSKNNGSTVSPDVLAALASDQEVQTQKPEVEVPDFKITLNEAMTEDGVPYGRLHIVQDDESDFEVPVGNSFAVKATMTALVDGFKTQKYAVLLPGCHLTWDLAKAIKVDTLAHLGYVSANFEGVAYTSNGTAVEIPVPQAGWAELHRATGKFSLGKAWTAAEVVALPLYDEDGQEIKSNMGVVKAFWKHEMLNLLVKGHNLSLSLGPRTIHYVKKLLETYNASSVEEARTMAQQAQYGARNRTRQYKREKFAVENGLVTGDVEEIEGIPDRNGDTIDVAKLSRGTVVRIFLMDTPTGKRTLSGDPIRDAAFLVDCKKFGYELEVLTQ